MTKTFEFQGKNIDRALEKASTELNIPVEKIKHEVVTYGSSGIFGLVGVKKAKIKVFLEAKKPNIKSVADASPNKMKDAEPNASHGIQEKSEIIDEEIINHGKAALKRILDGISEGTEIEYENRGDKIIYAVSGGDSGVLIGKRGQTLEAIQYLLEKIVNKKNNQRIRVIVDIEGYLEKRKANLKQMATKMAEKARRIQKPVTIGQMNSHDRRIVHIHLKNENGIRTQSIGEGYYRKLMIFPKKAGSPKKR